MGGKARPAPAGVRWLSAIAGLLSLAGLVIYLGAVRIDRTRLADYPAVGYFVVCLMAGSLGGFLIARRTGVDVAAPAFMAGLFCGLAVPTALTMAPLMLLTCLPFAVAAGWLVYVGGSLTRHVAVGAVSVGAGFVLGAFPIFWLNRLLA